VSLSAPSPPPFELQVRKLPCLAPAHVPTRPLRASVLAKFTAATTTTGCARPPRRRRSPFVVFRTAGAVVAARRITPRLMFHTQRLGPTPRSVIARNEVDRLIACGWPVRPAALGAPQMQADRRMGPPPPVLAPNVGICRRTQKVPGEPSPTATRLPRCRAPPLAECQRIASREAPH